jgi:hypothetical protein
MVVDEIVYRRLTAAWLWLGPLVAGLVLFNFEPGKWPFFPVCLFRALTGLACPGCGSTRALHQLLHGNLLTAFQLNPLLILALPLLLLVLFRYTNAAMRGQPFRTNTLHPRYIWSIFGVVLFFWIFRNTPFYPFVS